MRVVNENVFYVLNLINFLYLVLVVVGPIHSTSRSIYLHSVTDNQQVGQLVMVKM